MSSRTTKRNVKESLKAQESRAQQLETIKKREQRKQQEQKQKQKHKQKQSNSSSNKSLNKSSRTRDELHNHSTHSTTSDSSSLTTASPPKKKSRSNERSNSKESRGPNSTGYPVEKVEEDNPSIILQLNLHIGNRSKLQFCLENIILTNKERAEKMNGSQKLSQQIYNSMTRISLARFFLRLKNAWRPLHLIWNCMILTVGLQYTIAKMVSASSTYLSMIPRQWMIQIP